MLTLPLTQAPLGLPFTLNRASPQARGLVGWWPLLDSPGALKREHILGNHGVATSPITFGPDEVVGASAVNPSTGFIDIPASPLLNITGPLTQACWIKTTSTAAAIVFGFYHAIDPFPGYALAINVTANKFQWWDQAGAAWRTNNTAMNDGVWHHICGSFDGATLTMYLDGRADGSEGCVAPTPYAGARRIFDGMNGGAPTVGRLADARVYSRALSAAEVFALWAPQSRWELYGVNVRAGKTFVVLYDGTLSLGRSLAAADTALASAASAMTLPELLGQMNAGMATGNATEALNRVETVAGTAQADAGGSAALARSEAITETAAASTASAVTLARFEALTTSGLATFRAALGLARGAAVTLTGSAAALAASALGRALAIVVTTVGRAAACITVGARDLSSADVSNETTITVDANCGVDE